MIGLAVLAAFVAAWCWATTPAGISRRLSTPASRPDHRPRLAGVTAFTLLTAHAASALVVGSVLGRFAGVCLWCAGALALTIWWVLAARRRERRATRAADDVARGCAVLASQCRLGRAPAEALQVVAADVPIFQDAAGMATLGGDVAECWRRQAAIRGHGGLNALAAAWEVSATTGAALTTSLAAVATDLRRRHALHRLVVGELAAPRATSHLLAALPFAGLGLGQAVGARPFAFLASTGLGHGALMLATLLTCVGLVWSEALAAGAARSGGS